MRRRSSRPGRGRAARHAPLAALAALAATGALGAWLPTAAGAAAPASAMNAPAATATTTTATTAASPLAGLVLPAVGPGYTRLAQGPLTAARFASYSPNPLAAAATLGQLEADPGFHTYYRSWTTAGFLNAAVVLLVQFPSAAEAQAYLSAQRTSVAAGTGTQPTGLEGVEGAARFTYATTVPQAGTAQSLMFALGPYVATLTFTSASAPANTTPMTPARADALARGQYQLLTSAPGVVHATVRHGHTAGWLALGLAGCALLGMVAVGLLLGRRPRRPTVVPGGAPAPAATAAPGILAAPVAPAAPVAAAPATALPGAARPADWYPDPYATGGRLRYWDGAAWTSYVALPTAAPRP